MANPQKENGYTAIANETLEAIQIHKFSLNEMKIIMCVWRFTYGFNRKSHPMSLNFFVEHTGLNRSRVHNALKKLTESNVLIVEKGDAKTSNSYSFNKDYDSWKIEKYSQFNSDTSNKSDTSVQSETTTSIQNDTSTSVQSETTTSIQNDTSTSVQSETTTSIQNDTSTSVQFDTQERNIKEINKEDEEEEDEEEDNPVVLFEKNFFPMTPIQMEKVWQWVDDFNGNKKVVCMAIEETALKNPMNPFRYLERILVDWHRRRLFTVDDVLREKRKFEQSKVVDISSSNKRKGVDYNKLREMFANE